MTKNRAIAPPLSRAANEPTAEDIRIDVDVWCAHNLVSSSRGSSRRRRSSSGFEPSKRLEREHIECRPAEVERMEPAKRRAVSSKGGHTAFCIGRESAGGLIYSGLVSEPCPVGGRTCGQDRAYTVQCRGLPMTTSRRRKWT